MSFYFKHFLTDINASNCYVIGCSETKTAVIIDPSEYSEKIQTYIEKKFLDIKYIFITHNHYDHNQDVPAVLNQFNAEVINGNSNPVRKRMSISCGKMKFQAFPTPGHTPDSISFTLENKVFVGDLLFAGAVGGAPSYENHILELDQISKKILTLPEDFLLYPGHGPASTVRIEKQYNPFLLNQ